MSVRFDLPIRIVHVRSHLIDASDDYVHGPGNELFECKFSFYGETPVVALFVSDG